MWTYRDPSTRSPASRATSASTRSASASSSRRTWPGDGSTATTTNRFPAWGDASDLLHLIDVEPAGPSHFVAPPYRDTTRNVVEGGQMLAQRDRRRVEDDARPAGHVGVHDLLEGGVVRRCRSTSPSTCCAAAARSRPSRCASPRTTRCAAPACSCSTPACPTLFHGVGDDARRAGPGRRGAARHAGHRARPARRRRRVRPDPDRVGPARDLHVGAASATRPPSRTCTRRCWRSRPRTGRSRRRCVRTRGSARPTRTSRCRPGSCRSSIAFHDEVDVTEWLLYANPAIYAGRGLAQGEGRVFTRTAGSSPSTRCRP